MERNLQLRPATETDQTFLFGLFRALRAAWFDFQPGGHPQMTSFIRLQFQAREFALAGQYCGAEDSIVLLDGEAIGRIRVVRGDDEFRMADIALLPGRQRQGIGTAVMKKLLEEARCAGVPVRSVIALTDLPLFHFYRSLTFEVISEAAGHLRMEWRAA